MAKSSLPHSIYRHHCSTKRSAFYVFGSCLFVSSSRLQPRTLAPLCWRNVANVGIWEKLRRQKGKETSLLDRSHWILVLLRSLGVTQTSRLSFSIADLFIQKLQSFRVSLLLKILSLSRQGSFLLITKAGGHCCFYYLSSDSRSGPLIFSCHKRLANNNHLNTIGASHAAA